MTGQGYADFLLQAFLVVSLLGIAPSLLIAWINKNTTRDLYGLYRIVWVLVALTLFVLVSKFFAQHLSGVVPG